MIRLMTAILLLFEAVGVDGENEYSSDMPFRYVGPVTLTEPGDDSEL